MNRPDIQDIIETINDIDKTLTENSKSKKGFRKRVGSGPLWHPLLSGRRMRVTMYIFVCLHVVC